MSNCSIMKMVTNEVTINLNVLVMFMKYCVVSNLSNIFVIRIYMEVGSEIKTLISKSNQRNQTIYILVDVIVWSSASVKEWDTTPFVLLFQEIWESPGKIEKHVVETTFPRKNEEFEEQLLNIYSGRDTKLVTTSTS